MTLPAPSSAGGAIDEKHVYIPLQAAAEDQSTPKVIALDRESGSIAWMSEAESTRPLVVGNGLVVSSGRTELRALDAATGESKWEFKLTSNLTAPLVLGSSSILATTEPATISAIRSTDGEIAWTRPLAAPSQVAGAVGSQETAYLSLTDGRVVALSVTTGMPKWERKLSGTLTAPAVARDRVFVGSTDNWLYALDSDSGDVKWKWRTGGDVVGTAADENDVYYTALDSIVRRINRGNGHQRWKQAVRTRPLFAPLIVDRNVIVAGYDPTLSAFDAVTGTVSGTYTPPGDPAGDLQGSPLVDPVLRPFRVAIVVLLRDGRAIGLRPVGMMFRETAPEPFLALPGRALTRERLP